jgi:hypothetical protein
MGIIALAALVTASTSKEEAYWAIGTSFGVPSVTFNVDPKFQLDEISRVISSRPFEIPDVEHRTGLGRLVVVCDGLGVYL